MERGSDGEPRVKLVPLSQIEALRNIERDWGVQGLPPIKYVPLPDAVVQITAGPFQGEKGTVVSANEEEARLEVNGMPIMMPTRLLENLTAA